RLYGHLRRYKKIVKKTYIIFSKLLNYPTKVRVLTPQGIKLDIDAEEELNQKISRLESLS
ncbi:MAG: hypothetical protein UGE23_12295, partial [Peptococcaceae bacterium]|nr:hypothetical protein [Peptococcaceae bacterium]